MPDEQSDSIPVKFECPKCGGTEVVVSNGTADDSVASCQKCGQVFGLWADVKAKALEVAKAEVVAKFKGIFKGQ